MQKQVGYGIHEVKGKERYYKVKKKPGALMISMSCVRRIRLNQFNDLGKTIGVANMQTEVNRYFERMAAISPNAIIKSGAVEKVEPEKKLGFWRRLWNWLKPGKETK